MDKADQTNLDYVQLGTALRYLRKALEAESADPVHNNPSVTIDLQTALILEYEADMRYKALGVQRTAEINDELDGRRLRP